MANRKKTLRPGILKCVSIPIRGELTEFAEQQEAARKREEEKNDKKRQEYEARKRHHLVSTEVMPGIYNSPFLP